MEELKSLVFDCPMCPACTAGPLGLSTENVVEYRRPLVALWPGGPVVEDPGGSVEPAVVDRLLRTSACECVFPDSDWAWEVTVYPEGLAELVIRPRS